MKSAGELLKQARQQKKLSLAQASAVTKIPLSSLQKLEDGDYWSLPPKTYVKGFLRSYARFLGLDAEKIMAFFRREYKEPEKKSRFVPWLPLSRRSLTITPGSVLALIGASLILGFLFLLIWQYRNFAGSPLLVVFEPTDQQELRRPMVTVTGKSDPDAQVLINGEAVPTDKQGNFQKTIDLEEGVHTITIVAKSKLGKKTTLRRTVAIETPKISP